MKLLIIILQNSDLGDLSRELTANNVRFTKISSTGGYLNSGNTTIFTSVEDNMVEDVVDIVKSKCIRKKSMIYSSDGYEPLSVLSLMKGVEVTTGGAVVFVVDAKNIMSI